MTLDNNLIKGIDDDILRAVYALNMCTVSVSQIIDYNDVYILEQEYDAILNNLNLEKIPKAAALKNILVELLNTITFFRIHEMRKTSIEKNYQKRIKNAIWSAIPNMNIIVSGDPAAIAFSIATQVGIGYMNYRKEKNFALTEKEKEEMELKITAIEQFHALRRELFTTAWELAEEYDFNDNLRLTEKQIKQYNNILMDCNELRKYARLEAVKDKFKAFPPFWYNFGHTACFIAGNTTMPLEEWERDYYRKRAKEYFEEYERLNRFNILREDQMASAFALEYVDLLLLESTPDIKKINRLLSIADEMSGTALDIKQLCVIAYLKIGNTEKAAEILKILINEDYNTITNAKILSRIYVSQFVNGNSKTAKFDYKTLQLRIGRDNWKYLFPMPEKKEDDEKLQREYLVELKIILATDYNTVINHFMRKYAVLFNSVFPAPYGYENFEEYYGYTENAMLKRIEDVKCILKDHDNRTAYIENVSSIGFRFKFIDLLNEAMESFDDLVLWKDSDNHDLYVEFVKANIIHKKIKMKKIQDNMSSQNFTVDDYKILQSELSFRTLIGKMIDKLKNTIMDAIYCMDSMEKIENAEYNLSEFCQKYELPMTEIFDSDKELDYEMKSYLDYSLLGADGINEKHQKELYSKRIYLVKEAVKELIIGDSNEVSILLPGDEKFDLYFKNINIKSGSKKENTLCIIDDNTKKDCDLLLTQEQIIIIRHNKIKAYNSYHCVEYEKYDRHGERLLMDLNEYSNRNINIGRLYNLLEALKKTI